MGTSGTLLEEEVIFQERFSLDIQSGIRLLCLSLYLGALPLFSAKAQETDTIDVVNPAETTSLKVGKIEFANGSSYEGGLKLGQMHGIGVFKYESGDVYEGEFVDGQLRGEGILTFANGDRYEGSFISDQFSGRGVLICKVAG